MDKLNDMFVAILLIIAKKWKLHKYLPTGELKNKYFYKFYTYISFILI